MNPIKSMRSIPSSLAMVGLTLAAVLSPQARAADKPARKILFFSKSAGFEHSMIKKKGDQPSNAEKILAEIGAKHNYDFTFTKDGTVFTPENIAKYDAFFFYTTGDLTKAGGDKNPPMSPEGKAAFLDAIHNGKGFIGTHSATDTTFRCSVVDDQTDPLVILFFSFLNFVRSMCGTVAWVWVWVWTRPLQFRSHERGAPPRVPSARSAPGRSPSARERGWRP